MSVPLVLHDIQTSNGSEADEEGHQTQHHTHGLGLLVLQRGSHLQHHNARNTTGDIEEANNESLSNKLIA